MQGLAQECNSQQPGLQVLSLQAHTCYVTGDICGDMPHVPFGLPSSGSHHKHAINDNCNQLLSSLIGRCNPQPAELLPLGAPYSSSDASDQDLSWPWLFL